RSLLRSYRTRFSFVHIGQLSRIDPATIESQVIPKTQAVPGWTLSARAGAGSFGWRRRPDPRRAINAQPQAALLVQRGNPSQNPSMSGGLGPLGPGADAGCNVTALPLH